MPIVEARQVDDDLVAAMHRLVPQLDAAVTPPSRERLERILASPGSCLLIARAEAPRAEIQGMLTLVWYPIPTGVRAWIEDVVVDEAARGGGVGTELLRAALDRARREGASKVDLTSRPVRGAANALYERLGFERRNTNVYRYRLDDSASEPSTSQPPQ